MSAPPSATFFKSAPRTFWAQARQGSDVTRKILPDSWPVPSLRPRGFGPPNLDQLTWAHRRTLKASESEPLVTKLVSEEPGSPLWSHPQDSVLLSGDRSQGEGLFLWVGAQKGRAKVAPLSMVWFPIMVLCSPENESAGKSLFLTWAEWPLAAPGRSAGSSGISSSNPAWRARTGRTEPTFCTTASGAKAGLSLYYPPSLLLLLRLLRAGGQT